GGVNGGWGRPLAAAAGAGGPGPRLGVAPAPARGRRFPPVGQALKPGDPMRAASLLGVLIVAKAGILAGREVPLSVWTPAAYLWQDLLAGLLFIGLIL